MFFVFRNSVTWKYNRPEMLCSCISDIINFHTQCCVISYFVTYTLTYDLLLYWLFHVHPYFDQNSQQILHPGQQDIVSQNDQPKRKYKTD